MVGGRPGAGREPVPGQPPFANRGVETYIARTEGVVSGELLGSGLDYLTVSMGTETAGAWLPSTRLLEPGKPQPGFGSSERRECLGGQCWRRWEPHQESKRWAREYESWEFDGGNAVVPGRWFRGREVRPSRVDVAWDFSVAESETAEVVQDRVREHAEARGFVADGKTGEAGVFTCYVGSIHSERRLRIYRKDLKDEGWLLQFGPTLRVELILKQERAVSWWRVWSEDEARAIAAAAAHVLEITGRCVQADVGDVPPPLRLDDAVDPAQQLFWALKQCGGVLAAGVDAGVDVLGLLMESRDHAGRKSRWDSRLLADRMRAAGVDEVERWTRKLM